MMQRETLLNWCQENLQAAQFKDYAPNGLQVEGEKQIEKIITSVTASLAAIEFAIAQKAQMLLVHHGLFWKSEPIVITGWKKQRIAKLLANEINLVAYHLPLDAHPKWGNNAQLAEKMGWQCIEQIGEQNLLNIGTLPEQQTLSLLANQLETVLQRKPIVVGNLSGSLKKIAWCTGGAQSFFQQAIDAGVDAFITGEISEAQYHLANETGVAFISAGHHATERFGIQTLGEQLTKEFSLTHQFFDENNPV